MGQEEQHGAGAFPRNYLQGCLLLLVAESATHGYDLLASLAGLGLNNVDSGAVYRALRGLNAKGLVESWWEESDAGPRRRRYRVTAAGVAHLEAWASAAADSCRGLSSFVTRQRRLGHDRLPVAASA